MLRSVTPGERAHHLDAARMFLMLLGIPYHSALLFQNEIHWAASVGTVSPIARYIVAVIHIFRMPAFFLLSGYLAAIVLVRTDAIRWLKGRYLNLGIPLIFSLLVLHPTQIIVPMMLKGEVLTGAMRGASVGHLWFLFALLGIAPIAAALNKYIQRTDGISAAVLAAGAYAFVGVAIVTATIVRDFAAASDYPLRSSAAVILWGFLSGLPFMLLGMLMAHRPDVLRKLTFYSPIAYLCIAVMVAIYAVVMPLKVDTVPSTVIASLLAIPISTGIILACSRHFSQHSPRIAAATRSCFTIYLVHHPIIIILGTATAGLALPWYAHYAGICLVTWVLSYGIWLGVRNVAGLNVMLGAASVKLRRVERPVVA